jgi:hypothetical protein
VYGHHVGIIHTQIVEQVLISEYRGKHLPVPIHLRGLNRLAVESQRTRTRAIKSRQQFDQPGLATTVLAHDKERFASIDRSTEPSLNGATSVTVANV